MTPKKVKAIRLKLGLTQVQFAKQLNYTQANISKWESGAIKLGPRVEKAIWALAGFCSEDPKAQHAEYEKFRSARNRVRILRFATSR